MQQTEQLLATLAERESDLRQMRADMTRMATLAQAFDLIHNCKDIDKCFVDVLELCRGATGSDAWIVLGVPSNGDVLTLLATSEIASVGERWPTPTPAMTRELRVNDLQEPAWALPLPDGLTSFSSLLSSPIHLPFQDGLAIGLLSRRRAAYSRGDLELLRRVAHLLEQALENRMLAQRNATLTMVVDAEGEHKSAESRFFDSSFETLSRAFGKVANWQGSIVDITNELLGARTHEADSAINRALGRMGKLAAADRTYVFRLRDGSRLDNTHEWVAAGIEPMIDHLQDMPADLLDEWRHDFLAGRAVHISDVDALPASSAVREVLQAQQVRSLLAVPLLRDGVITGLVGYDAVQEARTYPPLEIQLLQSVCNAIGAVIERVAADARAEMALQGLHATLIAVPDLVLELDQDARFIGVYEGPGATAAYPSHRIIGRTPEEILQPELAANLRKILCIVDRDRRSEGHEYQITVRNELRTFSASAAAKVIKGRSVGYVVATRDITTQVELRRQLQRLGKIAELTDNLVVVTDAQQRIEWVNPAFERHTGWNLHEVRGKRPDSFLATELTDSQELARIGKLLRAKQPVRAELLNRNRAGEFYWISKDIQPLFDDNGEVEGFVAVQTDITELKRSHLDALRDRAMAFEASNDGIAITDESEHFTYMNRAHRFMFGIGLDEDVTQISWKDFYSFEANASVLGKDWPGLLENGVLRADLFRSHRDGSVLPHEVSLTKWDKGFLCITRDISERLNLEADRERMREDLQRAQSRETIAHLASGVAHDLNNLVAVVAGSATLLRGQFDAKSESRAGIDRILRATETAKDLVGGLGHLGRPHRSRSQHDLRKIIVEAINLLGTQRSRDYQINVSLPDARCPIWGNVTEILQVLVNLTLNACESGTSEGNTVRLAASSEVCALPVTDPDVGILQTGRGYVTIRVYDTGTGIDPDSRAHLFESYFTTKGTLGTGLGLPIVAGILRDNDAAMWIDSIVDTGTTVTVAWPTDDAPKRARAAEPSSNFAPTNLAGHKILVIDDQADIADIISEILETADAVSVAVSDPYDAADLLKENPGLWSALVTDLDMPGMRGDDIARAAAACNPPVPTVLITALPDDVGIDASLFYAVLAKPIEAELLITTVGHAISSTRPYPQKDELT